MFPEELKALMTHMEWADAQVWGAVLALPQTHADPFTRERLYHVHMVQWLYLQIWRGKTIGIREVSTFKDLSEIQSWGRDYYHRMREHLDSVDNSVLEEKIEFPWAQHLTERFGQARPTTFLETVLQVASHSTYHRGQVNARVRELGGEPAISDFIVWIWMGRPEPPWPEQGT